MGADRADDVGVDSGVVGVVSLAFNVVVTPPSDASLPCGDL
jgi:hypothetical protein